MADPIIERPVRAAELLLVEDNYADVLLTRDAFEAAKLANNLVVAGDGEEAMSMLRRTGPHAARRTPDLILLDLNLPRKDGREVLQEIRADPELRTIPVIVLTSSNADIDRFKTGEINANGYLVKPIGFEQLRQAVTSLDSLWFAVVVSAQTPGAETPDA